MFHVSLDCRNVDIGVGRRVGPCVYVCEREAHNQRQTSVDCCGGLWRFTQKKEISDSVGHAAGAVITRRASEGITSATAHFQRISAAEREMRIIDERDKLHCRDIKGGREREK